MAEKSIKSQGENRAIYPFFHFFFPQKLKTTKKAPIFEDFFFVNDVFDGNGGEKKIQGEDRKIELYTTTASTEVSAVLITLSMAQDASNFNEV